MIQQIKYRIFNLFADFKFAITRKYPVPKDGSLTILLYHGVVEDLKDSPNSKFISLRTFSEQMAYFEKNYHILSIEDCVHNRLNPEKHNICITFDDGFKVLEETVFENERFKQFPFTLFITALQSENKYVLWPDLIDNYLGDELEVAGNKFIRKGKFFRNSRLGELKAYVRGNKKRVDEIYSIINEEQLNSKEEFYRLIDLDGISRLITRENVTLGAHGVRHYLSTSLNMEEEFSAMQTAKEFLESFGKRINYYAFPEGVFTEKSDLIAKKLDYKALFYVDKKVAQNLQGFTRLGINPYISLNNQIRAIKNGHY